MTNLVIEQRAYQLTKTLDACLYPELEPYREETLSVSNLHTLWFAEYGNKHGIPVLVVHGGPGGGCGPRDMRFFDPQFYRIILCDQRGAGRSLPSAETRENTTFDLIADMETLRMHLGVEKWLLFGGSWGTALSLAYGQAHANRCLGFILRGVFLGTKSEYLKLWYNMGDFYPEAYEAYENFIPESERKDLIGAYHRRLSDPNPHVQQQAAKAFCAYDFTCATLFDKSQLPFQLEDQRKVLALAKLFTHYSMNEFNFTDDQLMNNLARITHLPAVIVHGRYDIICRVSSAYRLHRAWPQSKLHIVQDGGHASYEPSMAEVLVAAGNEFKNRWS